LQFTPFYRRTTDVIRIDVNTADTIAGREVTSIRFGNLDTSRSWGADMNGQLRAGRLNFERGRFSGSSATGLPVRQKLPRDNMFATLRVSNVFDTNRFRVELGDDHIIQLTDRTFNSRALHLSLEYSVGQAPRVRPSRQDQEPAPQTGFPGG
jgi:hypothetical protein